MTKLHCRAGVVGTLSATMIAAIIAVTAVPPPTYADNINNDKAQAAALAEQINADATQVQILDAQYDGAQYHLSQVQQQLVTAQQQLQVAQANADRSKAALAGEAVKAYMHGGVTSTPTVSAYQGGDDLAVAEGYFQLAVGNQTDALDQYRSSEAQLRQQQSSLNATEAADQTAVDQVTSRRQAVDSASAASQALLSQVTGQLAQLVAQQQAQIQAQEEAQVKAQLLAAQQAQAQAAQAQGQSQGQAAQAQAPATRNTASANNGGASPTNSGRTTGNASAPSSASNAAGSPSGGGSASAGTSGHSTTPTTSPSPVPSGPIPAASPAASLAIAYARAQIGKPYQWGGAGPGSFDCSGLTMMAWAAAGVSLPHYTGAQYADTAHVPIADLQPGDLVFFGSDLHHVGLYIGGGQMIDAPSTGEFVRVDSIYWPDLQPLGGRP
ncbi:MAG: C40 family peptidase [Acidimicrobiales bacterium]